MLDVGTKPDFVTQFFELDGITEFDIPIAPMNKHERV